METEMLTKSEIKKLYKEEFFSLKEFLNKTQYIYPSSKIMNDYQIDALYDSHYSRIATIFYSLNSLLLNIKYKIMINKGVNKKDIIKDVFEEQNGNNIYALFKWVNKNSTAKFSNDFIFLAVLIEALVRHQYSHGFGKALHELLNRTKGAFVLFYNKNLWNKYKEFEGNANAFFLLANRHTAIHDILNFIPGGGGKILMNSLSGRINIKYNWLENKYNNPMFKNKQSAHISKSIKNLITFYEYSYEWESYNSARIISSITPLVYGFNTGSITKENIINKLRGLTMFNLKPHENKINCECNGCNLFNIINIKTFSEIELRKKITEQNRIICLNYFEKIMNEKIRIAKKNHMDKKEFNKYIYQVIMEIFGKKKPEDFFSRLYNGKKLKENYLEELEHIFNAMFSRRKNQFLCYKFNRDKFIITNQKHMSSLLFNIKNIEINDQIFFNEIKKEMIKWYKKHN